MAPLHGALTPVGAERACNAAGSIPAWSGSLSARPNAGERQSIAADPFPGEQPLFTITPSNAVRYAAQPPQGTLALFDRFPDYRIRVYPAHGKAALPQTVYDAIARNATRAHAGPSGIALGIAGAAGGVPFPIPSNGTELVWEHLLAF